MSTDLKAVHACYDSDRQTGSMYSSRRQRLRPCFYISLSKFSERGNTCRRRNKLWRAEIDVAQLSLLLFFSFCLSLSLSICVMVEHLESEIPPTAALAAAAPLGLPPPPYSPSSGLLNWVLGECFFRQAQSLVEHTAVPCSLSINKFKKSVTSPFPFLGSGRALCMDA